MKRKSFLVVLVLIVAGLLVFAGSYYFNTTKKIETEFQSAELAYNNFEIDAAIESYSNIAAYPSLFFSDSTVISISYIEDKLEELESYQAMIDLWNSGEYENAYLSMVQFERVYPDSPYTQQVKSQIPTLLFDWANTAYLAEDYTETIQIIENDIPADEITSEINKILYSAYIDLAEQLLTEGNFSEAIETCNQVIYLTAEPGYELENTAATNMLAEIFSAQFTLANQLFSQGDYLEAIEIYTEILSNKSIDDELISSADNAVLDIYLLLADQQLNEKDYEKACGYSLSAVYQARSFDHPQADEFVDKFLDTCILWGDASVEEEKYQEAMEIYSDIKYYNWLFNDDSDDLELELIELIAEMKFQLAQVEMDAGNLSLAGDMFFSVLNQYPDSAAASKITSALTPAFVAYRDELAIEPTELEYFRLRDVNRLIIDLNQENIDDPDHLELFLGTYSNLIELYSGDQFNFYQLSQLAVELEVLANIPEYGERFETLRGKILDDFGDIEGELGEEIIYTLAYILVPEQADLYRENDQIKIYNGHVFTRDQLDMMQPILGSDPANEQRAIVYWASRGTLRTEPLPDNLMANALDQLSYIVLLFEDNLTISNCNYVGGYRLTLAQERVTVKVFDTSNMQLVGQTTFLGERISNICPESYTFTQGAYSRVDSGEPPPEEEIVAWIVSYLEEQIEQDK